MPRFEILAGGVVIGHSELEHGDPPMGVATGRFFPLTAYEAIQPQVVAARDGSQEGLGFSVRVAGGQTIPAQGGVRIDDYSAELGDDGIEVDVLRIAYPLYEELFPGRHEEYARGFEERKATGDG